jgi:hypothetical protein
MDEAGFRRIAGSGGIIFAVLAVIAFALPGSSPPGFDDSTKDVVKFFSENRNEHQVGALLIILGMVAFVFFLGALARRSRGAEGRAGGRLTATALAGGILFVAFGSTGGLFVEANAAHAGSISPDVTQGLYDAQVYAFNLGLAAIGVLLLASCSLSTRFGALPTWLGWLGGVVGSFNIIAAALGAIDDTGPFAPTDGILGFVAFFAFLVWTVAASVVLVRDPK